MLDLITLTKTYKWLICWNCLQTCPPYHFNRRWYVRVVLASFCRFEGEIRYTANLANGSYSQQQLGVTLVMCCLLFVLRINKTAVCFSHVLKNLWFQWRWVLFSPRRASWSTTNLSTNCSQRFLRRRPWRRVSGASGPQSVTHSLILIMEMTSHIVAPFFFYSLFDYCCAQLGKKPAQTSTRTQQQDGFVGAETSFFLLLLFLERNTSRLRMIPVVFVCRSVSQRSPVPCRRRFSITENSLCPSIMCAFTRPCCSKKQRSGHLGGKLFTGK